MKRRNKQTESDEEPGAPEWMVTFSDCMTLLLTFFVLLLSFSSFDNKIFPDLRVIYSHAFTSITPTPFTRSRDALKYIPPVRYVTRLGRGSETPTSAQEVWEALMKETGFADLQGGKVFLVSSKRVFWGQGKILSREGRILLDLIASFLERVPGRVVVCENGPADVQGDQNLGLPRAWVVMEYLTTRLNLDKNRFSISATGVVARKDTKSGAAPPERRAAERMLEITLLERNTYN